MSIKMIAITTTAIIRIRIRKRSKRRQKGHVFCSVLEEAALCGSIGALIAVSRERLSV